MSTRYLMARRSNTSESYQKRRASSAGPVAAAHGEAFGPRSPGGSSFQVRPLMSSGISAADVRSGPGDQRDLPVQRHVYGNP
jgi:hypothetical protein